MTEEIDPIEHLIEQIKEYGEACGDAVAAHIRELPGGEEKDREAEQQLEQIRDLLTRHF